ncbi:MAG: hypothetical protein ACR2KM_04200 [Gemmatimonadaceae bacterium]
MTAPNTGTTPTVDGTAGVTGVGTSTTPVTIPSGADMPAPTTNGVVQTEEHVGRGEHENRIRDAERNLAALDAHVAEHPDVAEAAKGAREMYEQMRDDSRKALEQQNAPTLEQIKEAEAPPPEVAPEPEVASPGTPAPSPARSGAPSTPTTDHTTQTP